MAIANRLLEDLKVAMRDKDVVARDTLRMIRNELSQKELELGRPLEDGDEIAVLARAVKTRQESIAQYEQGGRQDLVDKEKAEVAVIERYLPKAMSEEEAREAVAALVQELGASTKKDMGRVMKALRERYPGQIDGKQASKWVGGALRTTRGCTMSVRR